MGKALTIQAFTKEFNHLMYDKLTYMLETLTDETRDLLLQNGYDSEEVDVFVEAARLVSDLPGDASVPNYLKNVFGVDKQELETAIEEANQEEDDEE